MISRINPTLRLLGVTLAVAGVFTVVAREAQACTPRWVNMAGSLASGDGVIDVRIAARHDHVTIRLRAEDVDEPLSGEFSVLLNGAFEPRELTSFALVLDESGIYEETITLEEDVRDFLTTVEGMTILDGLSIVGYTDTKIAAGLRFRARQGDGNNDPAYRLRGLSVLRGDGRPRYKMEALTKGAQPNTMLTFRLSGGVGILEIDVLTDAEGNGSMRISGTDDLLSEALQWDEVVVFDGDDEIARMPLFCR